jgi:hypothetical protein
VRREEKRLLEEKILEEKRFEEKRALQWSESEQVMRSSALW